MVRDHRPLQQGLRQILYCGTFWGVSVRDHRPLQQGLRLWMNKVILHPIPVRDHRPLQQGLRQPHAHQNRRLTIRYETIVHYNKD